jgi:hypothetical protein
MARQIFYTFNASTPPADPDVNSTLYVAPLDYQVGYYKAIAKEDGVLSQVVSKSFGVSPEDYIHYYPLTDDFNDHAGSNHLLVDSGDATITTNGMVLNSAEDRLVFSNVISSSDVSISLTFTADSNLVNNIVINGDATVCNIYIVNGFIAYYSDAGGTVLSSKVIEANTTYRIVLVQEGTALKMYVDGVDILNTTCIDNSLAPINYVGNYSSGNYCATGIYKDLKIFNRTLTQEEINFL